jgi:hypothetical protein
MITGTVTLANSRLSLVDGTAFVDFSSAGTLTPYLNGRLTVTDSAGKKAVGYLKAAGTGEMLGDALNISNCVNVSYDTFDGASPTGFHAIKSTAGNKISTTAIEIPFVAGALFKTTYTVADGTISSVAPRNASAATIGPSAVGAIGDNTNYACVTETVTRGLYFISTANVEYTLSNLAIKKVTAPSITGATITSTRGGTTYNWASVEAGFNFNDASGYTYEIALPRFKKSKFISQYNYFYRRNR